MKPKPKVETKVEKVPKSSNSTQKNKPGAKKTPKATLCAKNKNDWCAC